MHIIQLVSQGGGGLAGIYPGIPDGALYNGTSASAPANAHTEDTDTDMHPSLRRVFGYMRNIAAAPGIIPKTAGGCALLVVGVRQ